jgi:hypothetical protein
MGNEQSIIAIISAMLAIIFGVYADTHKSLHLRLHKRQITDDQQVCYLKMQYVFLITIRAHHHRDKPNP